MPTAKRNAPLNLDKIIAERQSKEATETLSIRLFGQTFKVLPLSQIDLRAFASNLTEAEQALKVIESMFGSEQMAKIPPGALTAETAGIIVDSIIEAQGESAPLEPSESTSG